MALATRPRHLFSIDDYEAMVEKGVLGPDDRVELIDGEVLEMTPIGPRHQVCVDRLTKLFASLVGEHADVRVQGAIGLSPHSEPQPDLTLLRPPLEKYATVHPGPTDILLAVEVCDTTFAFDRDVKAPLYGKAGIAETWLVDLAGRRVLAMTQPGPGGYKVTTTYAAGETVTARELPRITIAVGDILGRE